jgi:hypothetical protein
MPITYGVPPFSRYQVPLDNACRESLIYGVDVVKQSLKNKHYQVELGNEPHQWV